MTTTDQLAAIEARLRSDKAYDFGTDQCVQDRDALLAMVREQRAVIERVEALAEEWNERWGRYSEAAAALGPQKVSIEFAVKSIRAALTATEAAK